MIKLELETKNVDKIKKEITKFRRIIKQGVIEKGLDNPIQDSINELKKTLKFIINEEIRNEKVQQGSTITEPTIDAPKADVDLLKHLSGVDINNARLNRGNGYTYTKYGDPEAIAIDQFKNFRQGTNYNLVRFRQEIKTNESFGFYHSRAVEFFNKAVFILKDGFGRPSYYINPGIDLNNHVKIVCSRDTGETDNSRERFELDREKRGSAEWALEDWAVENVIKTKFIQFNPILEQVKDGDYDNARVLLQAKAQNNTKNLVDKVTQIEDGSNLTPDVATHANIIKLINGIRIKKRKRKNEVIYSLYFQYEDMVENQDRFWSRIERNIKLWKLSNYEIWFNRLKKVAENITKRFAKG